MITWMQRHRKYLVVTIWISTIAFIGAGFVGWGQYSYGAKSGAIAEVGEVSITQREWQQAYSSMFNRYSQIFQGKFDEEQAKKLGLDKQALRQLVNEALLINLANSYNLEATDREVAEIVQAQQAFFENGVFSKALYQKVLKQNRMTSVEYEDDLRKSILIQKVLALFAPSVNATEKEAFQTALGIADKIEYKLLTGAAVTLDTSDQALEAFWQTRTGQYMTPTAYKIEYLLQPVTATSSEDAALREYYDAHKYDFADAEGKLLSFDAARDEVQAALDTKEANKAALKTYIAYKKDKLDEGIRALQATVTAESTLFSAETLDAIAGLSALQPYLKPRLEGDKFVIVKLVEAIAPMPLTFAEAKTQVLKDYKAQETARKLLETASTLLKTFRGKTTADYLNAQSTSGFEGLNETETRTLLGTVFKSDTAEGVANLAPDKLVLFRVVDQKIVPADDEPGLDEAVVQIKTALLNNGLIERLETRYPANIFVQGFTQ